MDEKQIEKIMKVLSDWNPLGNHAASVVDLDGYRCEAIDIIAEIYSNKTEKHILKMVRELLNEAFLLSLNIDECIKPAKQIFKIVHEK